MAHNVVMIDKNGNRCSAERCVGYGVYLASADRVVTSMVMSYIQAQRFADDLIAAVA